MAPLSDAEQIRNLIAAFAHATDARDTEAVAGLFTADGQFVLYDVPIPVSRLPEFTDYLAKVAGDQEQPRGSRHIQSNTHIHTLEESGARATTDLVMIDLTPDKGWHVGATGQYLDEFVKVDGRWLLQRREVRWYKDLGRNPLAVGPQDTLVRAFSGNAGKRP